MVSVRVRTSVKQKHVTTLKQKHETKLLVGHFKFARLVRLHIPSSNVLQLTEAGPQPVDTDNIGLNFDLDATGICGGLSFLGSEITFAQCDGPDNLRSYICEGKD